MVYTPILTRCIHPVNSTQKKAVPISQDGSIWHSLSYESAPTQRRALQRGSGSPWRVFSLALLPPDAVLSGALSSSSGQNAMVPWVGRLTWPLPEVVSQGAWSSSSGQNSSHWWCCVGWNAEMAGAAVSTVARMPQHSKIFFMVR